MLAILNKILVLSLVFIFTACASKNTDISKKQKHSLEKKGEKSLESKKWDSLETYLREGSPGNDYSRRNLDLLLFNSIHKPEIIEGGYTCKCGSEKTESIRQQLRSADEPTSAKVTCMNPTCRRTWKVNA